jgi:hypothetical protein
VFVTPLFGCRLLKEGRDRLQRRLLEARICELSFCHSHTVQACTSMTQHSAVRVSCYQVPTSLWRRIHLTTKHSEDVGAMHFQTVSENQLVHNLTNKLLMRSFWATWREANFNLTSKVEGQKPGTERSEGRELRQAICTLLKIVWRKNFHGSASIRQFRTTSGHEAQHARLSSSPRLLNETPDITFHFVVILNCPRTTEARRQVSRKTQIFPPAVTLATCMLILPKSNDNPKWDL